MSEDRSDFVVEAFTNHLGQVINPGDEVFYVVLVWLPLIYKGLRLNLGLYRIGKSIVSMPVVYLYTMYIFFESMLKELVFGNQLKVWHKGH